MRTLFHDYVWIMVLLVCPAGGGARAEDTAAPPPAISDGSAVPAATNAVAPAAPAHTSGTQLFWNLRWDNGLQYELGSSRRLSLLKERHPDADVEPYHGRIGLKLQFDAADYLTGSGAEKIPNEDGVRRARLYTTGSFFLAVPAFYKVEAEVANGAFYVRETYVSLADLPLFRTLKIGYFKAPMTLEGYTSAGDTLFLERAAPVEAFGPGIVFGVQPAGVSADQRLTWAFGWFADGGQQDVSESSKSLTRAIGRVTWLPLYAPEPGQTRLVHLGASTQFMFSEQGVAEYRSRPESYFAPRVVDTECLDAKTALSGGLELAAEQGPWSVQSELLVASVNRVEAADLLFYGFYVAGSWLLTGENRPYNQTMGAFGRVEPSRKFSLRDGTFGAWELVARISHLDLDDGDVQGGRLSLATVGLNGYLTSRLKIMCDYAFGHLNHGANDGSLRILGGRVQYEF